MNWEFQPNQSGVLLKGTWLPGSLSPPSPNRGPREKGTAYVTLCPWAASDIDGVWGVGGHGGGKEWEGRSGEHHAETQTGKSSGRAK